MCFQEHGILNWSKQFYNLLKYFNFQHIWDNNSTFSYAKTLNAFVSKVKSEFVLFWNRSLDDQLQNDLSLSLYRQIKPNFGIAEHLSLVDNFFVRKYITKLRASDLRININILRFARKPAIPKNERLCKRCDLRMIDDENHILFVCPKFDSLRFTFLREALNTPILPLANSSCKRTLNNIGRFLAGCLRPRKTK